MDWNQKAEKTKEELNKPVKFWHVALVSGVAILAHVVAKNRETKAIVKMFDPQRR